MIGFVTIIHNYKKKIVKYKQPDIITYGLRSSTGHIRCTNNRYPNLFI